MEEAPEPFAQPHNIEKVDVPAATPPQWMVGEGVGMKQISERWRSTAEKWPALTFYQRFESVIALFAPPTM